LIGPHEVLERIQEAGGLPDEIVDSPGDSGPSAATESADEQMRALGRRVLDSLGPERVIRGSIGDDAAHRMAWIISVTTSMRESVPRERRCRHIRAADPKVTEIRTHAALSAGIWQCVECFRQTGAAALKLNPWPNECDLCGAHGEKFNEFSANIPGCLVTGNICARCASFIGTEATA